MKKLMIMLILSAFSISAFAYGPNQQDTTKKYRHHKKVKREATKRDTTKRVPPG